ncbi:MAG: SHOCT domain-containing protein [Meiothermus sp.]|nr:SHOCT domain-containing protein [Meiothermus sp.]
MEIALAHGYGYGFNPFLAFFGFLFNLLFFFLFIAFLVWLVRGMKRGRWGNNGWRQMRTAGGPWGWGPERMRDMRDKAKGWFEGADDAMEVARERFAKGEISREQLETIRAGLHAEQAQAERQAKSFWSRDSALETARMRFAKGEISLEEYESIKRGLES